MPRGQHRLMVAARSLAISTTLEQRAARLFFDRALRFVMRHPPLLSVGPTGRIAAVRRCAAYLLPAGPPRRSASHITAADLILDHICPRIGQCWRHSKTGGCETAMKQYADAGIRTLQNALFDHMNSDDLKKLGALTKQKLPSRKGDLVDVITRHLEGDGLQTAWRGLDELQRAAVAEVVHSEETYFPADLFRAKYGRDPVWESNEENRYYRKPSPLCFFFYNGIMPDDLKARLKTFVPPPAKVKIASLDRLPATYDVAYKDWNVAKRTYEEKTEPTPMAVHTTERAAQRELL